VLSFAISDLKNPYLPPPAKLKHSPKREHSARPPVQFFEAITTDRPFALILPAHSSLISIGLIGRVRAISEALVLASIAAVLVRHHNL
jgi:hypothetical protein